MTSRRTVLKGAVAAGSLATFAAGYTDTAKHLVKGAWAGEKPRKALTGNAPDPEYRIDPKTGAFSINPDQQVSYAQCIGCTTQCGVRIRVDKRTGKVIRVAGNPYSPMSTDPFIPYETSVRDSYRAMAQAGQDNGMLHRSTACGRGNAVLQQIDNPRRVLRPLKRVGPRGSGQWQTISFEQLIQEVVDGGDLFGEGSVAGLKDIRDLKTPIDPQAPELGPRANRLAVMNCVNDGRDNLLLRWLKQSFGSNNFVRHGSYCGGAYRSGSGAMFGDFKKMPHAKPDFLEAEFILFVGTAPGNAGNPFKRVGNLIAKARSDGKLRYIVVDPVLNNSQSEASGQRVDWVPIRPGTDGALAMALMRWMFENDKIASDYLAQPSAKAADQAGEASWSNATHLVITGPDHPRNGHFLHASDMGLPFDGEALGDGDPVLVASDNGPIPAADSPAPLFFEGSVNSTQGTTSVSTALTLLRQQAQSRTLADYAAITGIPEQTLIRLATELTSHGRKAAVNSHGGMMSGSGFYNAFALAMLNTLLGNLNLKGGTMIAGGWYPDTTGPRYDLHKFPGMVKARGVPIGRNIPFEKTSEFKRKKAAGSPYSADAPWYPNAPGLATEWISTMANGYPYGIEALIFRNTNPVYGIPGAGPLVERLKDPRVVPLIVAIDPFINESGAIADYIVPDSVMYETWGFSKPWGGVATKATTARWPVIDPKMDKTADGQPIGLEAFLIATAKRMSLPGFGDQAIPDADGTLHPLNRAEDWFLRGAANVAFAGGSSVSDATDDDIALSGVSRLQDDLRSVLKADEWRKAATIFAKGGRYENSDYSYHGDRAAHPFKKPMMVYNEGLGTTRHATTGRRFPGTPAWKEPTFADGQAVSTVYPADQWPIKIVSFKSPLQNSYSIGAPALRRIVADNPALIGTALAARHGLHTGDLVRLTTPGGHLETVVVVRDGIEADTVAIMHGYGHRAFGAQKIQIDDTIWPADEGIAAGVLLNDLGLMDPTRGKNPGVWVDPVSGTAVRHGLPAQLTKLT